MTDALTGSHLSPPTACFLVATFMSIHNTKRMQPSVLPSLPLPLLGETPQSVSVSILASHSLCCYATISILIRSLSGPFSTAQCRPSTSLATRVR